ncbi:MAG: glycosyltransferase [candidate division Zixibacteria bacterium]|nr:glycosyltransferase [candidate division Zixibacteria bacterium]
MTTDTTCQPHQSAGAHADAMAQSINESLDRGDFQTAFQLLEKLNDGPSRSGGTLVVAGLTALQLNRPDEARREFEEALALEPNNTDALHNLALLDLAGNDPAAATARLRTLKRLQPNDASVRNDLAVLWQSQDKPARALAGFRQALRIDPNFSLARTNAMQLCLERGWRRTALRLLDQPSDQACTTTVTAERNRWRRMFEATDRPSAPPTATQLSGRRIAFFASHDAFVKDFISDFSTDNTVRVFNGTTVERMKELLAWADVAWFEWCDHLLVAATKLPKRGKIVCRLHSYEAFTDMPEQVDWTGVDHLIYVNQSVRDIIGARIPASVPTTVIHNGVDTNRYNIPADKPTTKKIASVGYINYKKNPALLLYCFKKIHEHDPAYTLHVAGAHQDPRIQLYMENFLKRHPLPVFFEGWVEDMPSWYRDKQFVISTSLFESFHYSIAEGMASGVLPLIHDWYGADYLYPSEYLYADPDGCLELIRKLERTDLASMRTSNQTFIAERYNQAEATGCVRQVLADLAASTERSQADQ